MAQDHRHLFVASSPRSCAVARTPSGFPSGNGKRHIARRALIGGRPGQLRHPPAARSPSRRTGGTAVTLSRVAGTRARRHARYPDTARGLVRAAVAQLGAQCRTHVPVPTTRLLSRRQHGTASVTLTSNAWSDGRVQSPKKMASPLAGHRIHREGCRYCGRVPATAARTSRASANLSGHRLDHGRCGRFSLLNSPATAPARKLSQSSGATVMDRSVSFVSITAILPSGSAATTMQPLSLQ